MQDREQMVTTLTDTVSNYHIMEPRPASHFMMPTTLLKLVTTATISTAIATEVHDKMRKYNGRTPTS